LRKEPSLVETEEAIDCASRSHVPVLITCRNRDASARIAQLIHTRSTRAHGPFVNMHCTGPQKPLIERQLFGDETEYMGPHEEAGVLAKAHNGTLFLDEVGELSLWAQQRLHGLLGTLHMFRTSASDSPVPLDVRLITASNRPLTERVLTREFSEDLFYRLNVIHIVVDE
jgi:DNA-binding NtrC family response regulator